MEDSLERVIGFYDTHPINESQIMAALAEHGIALETITEDELQAHDQDHYGGLGANLALADAAGIGSEDHVLDVCCGLGGPARWLAHNRGCRVTGFDLTLSRIEGARRLTALAGLDGCVTFRHGNALAMPFEDGAFDVIVSQEAFAHVPDKDTLIAECARLLRSGGRIAFTDILAGVGLGMEGQRRLRQEMTFNDLASAERYRALMAAHGIELVEVIDLGAAWTELLKARLAMYRSLKVPTTKKFGDSHFRRWDAAYAFFVARFATGELTGARFVGRRT